MERPKIYAPDYEMDDFILNTVERPLIRHVLNFFLSEVPVTNWATQ